MDGGESGSNRFRYVKLSKGNGMQDETSEKKSGFDTKPGPDNFDLNKYIAAKSTFPVFDHRVFLDQEAGAELGDLDDHHASVLKKIENYREAQRLHLEGGDLSLADDRLADIAVAIDECEQELERLAPLMSELREKILATSLVLHFKAGTPQKYGKVLRQAEKEYTKAHGKVDENDVEHITGRTRNMLVHQLAAYCVKVETSDGVKHDPLDVEGFGNLVDSLISSETMRLLTEMNKGLDASNDWASRVDAGFPGGGTDVGSEPVGRSGAEDGALLGGYSA